MPEGMMADDYSFPDFSWQVPTPLSAGRSENVQGQAFMLVNSQANELNKMLEEVQEGISRAEGVLDDLRQARETLIVALRGTEKVRGVESEQFGGEDIDIKKVRGRRTDGGF
jgi:hypothetical protein